MIKVLEGVAEMLEFQVQLAQINNDVDAALAFQDAADALREAIDVLRADSPVVMVDGG